MRWAIFYCLRERGEELNYTANNIYSVQRDEAMFCSITFTVHSNINYWCWWEIMQIWLHSVISRNRAFWLARCCCCCCAACIDRERWEEKKNLNLKCIRNRSKTAIRRGRGDAVLLQLFGCEKVKSNCFETLGNKEADARIGNLNNRMKLERNCWAIEMYLKLIFFQLFSRSQLSHQHNNSIMYDRKAQLVFW